MTNKLTELTHKQLTPAEFEQWQQTWDKVSPVPQQVHDYVSQVLYKQSDAAFAQWDELAKSAGIQ